MNMFMKMAWRERFVAKLRVIEQSHPTAAAQGKGECCRSGVCCWRRPGALAPADVPAIAAFLGVTPEALFRERLIVDALGGDLMLLPARAGQQPGRMISAAETYDIETPCGFLGPDNACTIHDVKPAACRHYQCWNETNGKLDSPAWDRAELERLGWDGYNPDDWDD